MIIVLGRRDNDNCFYYGLMIHCDYDDDKDGNGDTPDNFDDSYE